MIIGWSPIPTKYRLTSPKGEVYVRCGADLILNGLRGDVDAEARCPVCGSPMKFSVRVNHIVNLQPPEAVLHIVEIPGPSTMIECGATHLFDKKVCLRLWQETYKGSKGSVYTPQGFTDYWLARQALPVPSK